MQSHWLCFYQTAKTIWSKPLTCCQNKMQIRWLSIMSKKTICVVWILVMLSIPRRSKIQKNHLKNLTSSDGRHVTVHYADSTVTLFKMQYILICINIFGWKLAIVTQFICLCLYWGFSISTLTSFCGTEKNCFSQFYWVQFVLSKNIKQLALAWSVIMLDDMSDWGIKITHRLLLGNQMV